jgi:hypothetical protein
MKRHLSKLVIPSHLQCTPVETPLTLCPPADPQGNVMGMMFEGTEPHRAAPHGHQGQGLPEVGRASD